MPTDQKTRQPRRSILTPSTFISVPDAFPGVDEGLANAFKFGFQVIPSEANDQPPRFVNGFLVDLALIDVGAVSLSAFDFKKMARDCELLRDAFLNSPDEVLKIIAAFQPDTPPTEITQAFKIAQRLGLTEEAVMQ